MSSRKGAAGEEGISTIVKLFLMIAAVVFMFIIAMQMMGSGVLYPLSILRGYSGGALG